MNARQLIKKEALNRLKDNWVNVVIVIVIASLLVTIANIVVGILQKIYFYDVYDFLNYTQDQFLEAMQNPAFFKKYYDVISQMNLLSLISIGASIIAGVFTLAQIGFILNVAGGGKPELKEFFKTGRWWESIKLELLIMIKIFLWTLLFVIPGIIKIFSYAMAPYLKYNNPDKSCAECIDESKRLMNGYKGSYFVLMLSFIGWAILAGLVINCSNFIPGIAGIIISNIVSLVVMSIFYAYTQTSSAIFYKELTYPYLRDKAAAGMSAGGSSSNNVYGMNSTENGTKTVDPFESDSEKKIDPFENDNAKEENAQSDNKGNDDIKSE